MATYSGAVRRGLPRTSGGEPWPPADFAPSAGPVVERAQRDDTAGQPPVELAGAPVVERAERDETTSQAADVSTRGFAAREATGVGLRRGLPRSKGGEPWPPADFAPSASPVVERAQRDDTAGQPPVELAGAPAVERAQRDETTSQAADVSTRGFAGREATGVGLRRGLPRIKGGEPWPPADFAPSAGPVVERAQRVETTAGQPPVELSGAPVVERAQRDETTSQAADVSTRGSAARGATGTTGRRTGLPRPGTKASTAAAASAPAAAPVPATAASAPAAASAPSAVAPAARGAAAPALPPLPFTSSVRPGEAAVQWEADRARTIAARTPITAPEPVRHGPFTTGQWVGAAIVAAIALIGAAGMLVMLTRWFLSVEFMQSFLATYPGAYELPEAAPVGFPMWLNWQHFLNIFFMVLIIRSGLYVRHQKRPPAFWSPRGNPKRKISINLWFHQALDILWLVNGVVFVVLLFVTGQWMRLVPTDWSVFPNALSAGLQYLSLDWPIEDGWINYNSLQQLAYFAVVFLAAPLAAITGVRMSGVWPQGAKTLNRIYPVEWARAVHFPTMLFFVLFIVAHVTLVATTGILHNLNAMFASNSGNGWVGFWFFVGAMIIVAIGWVAARPLVLAPIAKLFGRVSER